MSGTDKVFEGSIPALYDAYLVPLLFTGYAADLAQRVAAQAPHAVLEIAAGTGVLTRALAPLLPPEAHYVVTDLSAAMLHVAERRQGMAPRLVWQQADAMRLPFDDASFDGVCCQFGVMFFPDRVAAYREMRRVLKPNGAVCFNVWDAICHNDFARTVTDVGRQLFPHDPPLFMERAPHGYHDTGQIQADLRAAGFTVIAIETVERRSVAATGREPALGMCQGSPLRAEIEARDAGQLEQMTDLAAAAIGQAYGGAPVSGKIQAHVVVASC